MKSIVLAGLMLMPPVIMARGQTPAENVASQAVAANNASKSPLDGSAIASRATATSAVATRAMSAPVLDGKTDDPAWRDA